MKQSNLIVSTGQRRNVAIGMLGIIGVPALLMGTGNLSEASTALLLAWEGDSVLMVDEGIPVSSQLSEPVAELIAYSTPLPASVNNDVPFTAQAPYGDWDDDRQNYGCEESSLLMAMAWVTGDDIAPDEALASIIEMTEYEIAQYGYHHDTSIKDTHTLLVDYFGYSNAYVEENIDIDDIRTALAEGNLVIIPVDGTELDNPYYTPPGPAIHQILVTGYDDNTGEFITNDPGTKYGESLRYTYGDIARALQDYESGYNEPVVEDRTAMLVIEPSTEYSI